MTRTSGFEVSRDNVRPLTYTVTHKELSGGIAKLTLDSSVNSGVAQQSKVTIFGVPKSEVEVVDTVTGYVSTVVVDFNGTYDVHINDNIIDYNLSYEVTVDNVACTGTAFFPNFSFIRYNSSDTIIDDISSSTSFYVETWDYHTIRIVCGFDSTIDAIVQQDIADGFIPRIAICRSAFGYPSTPIDGEKIVDISYDSLISYSNNTKVIDFININDGEPSDGSYKRPISSAQGIYDRSLPSGRWYYYTLFFFVRNTSPDYQEWVATKKMDALTPINYRHTELLYDMMPPYYRYKDQEFTAGTEQQGILESFLNIIGFELDYTKTLAEGVENIYNIDYVHDDLLDALGVMNFGVAKEASLGDSRYRAIVATANDLYDRRGSSYGTQKLISAASKYRTKALEGINILNLTDDAEFAVGTGSWGDLTTNYSTFLSTTFSAYGSFNKAVFSRNPEDFRTYTYNIVDNEDPQYSVVPRQGSLRIEPSSSSGATLIACGWGRGATVSRNHTSEEKDFYPKLDGVRCTSGKIYTFSFYVKNGSSTSTSVRSGIMWFNSNDQKIGFTTADYISKGESSTAVTFSNTIVRCSVDAVAPSSTRNEPFVYAVPYILFNDSIDVRYVSGCMLNEETNSALNYVITTDNYLTLGASDERLGSSYVLGSN